MDEWNEEFLGFEAEREIQKHNAERKSLTTGTTTTGATGEKSGCGKMLLLLFIGLLLWSFLGIFFNR
jgi:hypothetical protein